MKKETKCRIAEFAGEVIIGAGIGVCLDKIVLPKLDSKADKVLVYAAGTLLGMPVGYAWSKSFFWYCDTNFGTELLKESNL